MRIFTVSDLHLDHPENLTWSKNISLYDYQEDILILGGDILEQPELFEESMFEIAQKFKIAFFVPGNHDLYLTPGERWDSLEKYERMMTVLQAIGFQLEATKLGELTIVPMLSWYDYSFGQPPEQLLANWPDFKGLRWPDDLNQLDAITQYFLEKNKPFLAEKNETVISFSHFMPRVDLLPDSVGEGYRLMEPFFGCEGLEEQIRELNPDIHIYGHSHINLRKTVDGITYLNNALGYPKESAYTRRRLLEVTLN